MSLKLDLSNAFDRVEWDFLQVMMMEKVAFPRHFIMMIMARIRSTFFYLLINGQPSTEIHPMREIRQGDPIFLFLFLICAKGFSGLLRNAKIKGTWKDISMTRGNPEISPLLCR